MNEAEKTAFRRFYALRWWERDGGFAGDVSREDIQVRQKKWGKGFWWSACLHVQHGAARVAGPKQPSDFFTLPPALALCPHANNKPLRLQTQKIRDKYNPSGADLREYKRAKAEGKLAEYWASRQGVLAELTGSSEPPAVPAAQ